MPESEASTVERAMTEYVRRAGTLRQIHSNKAGRASKWGLGYLVATLVIASIVTLLGIAGPKTLAVTWQHREWEGFLTILLSVSAFLVLLVTIVGFIYRFDERASRHFRSVELLTEFLRDTEDAVRLNAEDVLKLTVGDLNVARTRYKGLLLTLPPSTDKEYRQAKKDEAEKRLARRSQYSTLPVRLIGKATPGSVDLAAVLSRIIVSDSGRLSMLQAVERAGGEDAWITGGYVRDTVWDHLHGYQVSTPLDDVDVIFFLPLRTTKRREVRMQLKLEAENPNIKWSVKNEARMHRVAGDHRYLSIRDAVAHFPETATAVAIQLREGEIRIIAPLGLGDLFSFRVRQSPKAKADAYAHRVATKNWKSKWPKLEIDKPTAIETKL